MMYRIDFYATREDYEDRRPDSTFDAFSLPEALAIQETLFKHHPAAVVAIGR